MSKSPKCLIWDSFTTKNRIQREYVLICNTIPYNSTRQSIKTSLLSTFLWSNRYEPRPEIHLLETICFSLREVPAKDKQQMSHAHACLSIHPQKYSTPVFLRGFYEEQVKRRQTEWEMCLRKWSREPWIMCVCLQCHTPSEYSQLIVSQISVRYTDDMSYKERFMLHQNTHVFERFCNLLATNWEGFVLFWLENLSYNIARGCQKHLGEVWTQLMCIFRSPNFLCIQKPKGKRAPCKNCLTFLGHLTEH